MATTTYFASQTKANPREEIAATPKASAGVFYPGTMVMQLPASGTVAPAAATTPRAGDFPFVLGHYEGQTLTDPTSPFTVVKATRGYRNGDSITQANVGSICYAQDNDTVVKATDGTLPFAGTIVEVTTNLVFVAPYTAVEAALASGSLSLV